MTTTTRSGLAALQAWSAAAGLTPADIDRFELSDLAQLPVMTKTQMMANFDDVVTDRRLTRALVERHITDSATEPLLILGDYVVLASGGSSGLRHSSPSAGSPPTAWLSGWSARHRRSTTPASRPASRPGRRSGSSPPRRHC